MSVCEGERVNIWNSTKGCRNSPPHLRSFPLLLSSMWVSPWLRRTEKGEKRASFNGFQYKTLQGGSRSYYLKLSRTAKCLKDCFEDYVDWFDGVKDSRCNVLFVKPGHRKREIPSMCTVGTAYQVRSDVPSGFSRTRHIYVPFRWPFIICFARICRIVVTSISLLLSHTQ